MESIILNTWFFIAALSVPLCLTLLYFEPKAGEGISVIWVALLLLPATLTIAGVVLFAYLTVVAPIEYIKRKGLERLDK